MPSKRLTLFDIIVDLVPGVLFLVFLLLFIDTPSALKPLSNALNVTIVLLAVGYSFGRIIHTFAARNWVENIMVRIGWKVVSLPIIGSSQLKKTRRSSGKFDFSERLSNIAPEYMKNDENYDHNDRPLEYEVIVQLVENIENQFNGGQSLKNDVDVGDSYEKQWESDYEYIEYIGHSLLHHESSLYQRYTILATFYRNLWITVLLGALGLLVWVVYQFPMFIIFKPLTPYMFVTVLYDIFIFSILNYPFSNHPVQQFGQYQVQHILGIVVAVPILLILNVRWLEFRYRRLRALIIDLLLIMRDRDA